MVEKHVLKGIVSFSLSILISISAIAAEAKRPKSWVRVGELGPKPKCVTNEFPLSDQINKGHWKKYELMNDEFDGAGLDPNKWYPKNPRWIGRQPAFFYEGNVCVLSLIHI